jgi:type I restriction enzyme S subunit
MTGATIGKIGRSLSVKEKQCLVNQRVGIIRSKGNINNDYLYYILSLSDFRRYIEVVGCGAAQANISAFDIGKFTLQCTTDKTIQKKIAKVLNNYDQLIENNNKRIQLLESMAEELYKEWFVRFRFPGYENMETKLQSAKGWTFGDREDGQIIPNDWDFKELIEIAEFRRGRNITSSEMSEGEVPVIAAGLEPSGYHNQSNVKGYNLTVSASGANAGYLAYHLEDIWAADCSYYQNDDNV